VLGFGAQGGDCAKAARVSGEKDRGGGSSILYRPWGPPQRAVHEQGRGVRHGRQARSASGLTRCDSAGGGR
jgi:hypothetical protein